MARCGTETNEAVIASGIVTYNPDMGRLRENLNSILPQVDRVFIFDNASKNINELRLLIEDEYKSCPVSLCVNSRNAGMAVALNALAKRAIADGYEQILFLDQDSVAGDNLLVEEMQIAGDDIGIVCPQIYDRNEKEQRDNPPSVCEVERAITAGSLLNLNVFSVVGGYDERLFIDWVDFDYCASLALHGYRILKTGKASILHEVGRKEYAGKTIVLNSDGKPIVRSHYRTNHSPMRRRDKARSMAIMARKYSGTAIGKKVRFWIMKSVIRDIVYEKRKLEFVSALISGYREGAGVR